MKLGGMWMNNIVQEMIDWIERHLLEGFSLEQLGKVMVILLITVLLNSIRRQG